MDLSRWMSSTAVHSSETLKNTLNMWRNSRIHSTCRKRSIVEYTHIWFWGVSSESITYNINGSQTKFIKINLRFTIWRHTTMQFSKIFYGMTIINETNKSGRKTNLQQLLKRKTNRLTLEWHIRVVLVSLLEYVSVFFSFFEKKIVSGIHNNNLHNSTTVANIRIMMIRINSQSNCFSLFLSHSSRSVSFIHAMF